MLYKLTENGVIRLSDKACIPDDPANRDWRKYQEWLTQGNIPEPIYTSIEKVKTMKISEAKQEAKTRIERDVPDWKVIAHLGQQRLKENGIKRKDGSLIDTSMTDTEYIEYEKERESIREASNAVEQEIDALTTIDDVLNLDVVNNPKWK